jgi:O-antigen ligase
MSRLATFLSAASFWTAFVPVVVGPWLFGSWETWWFWPMAALLAASALLSAADMAVAGPWGQRDRSGPRSAPPSPGMAGPNVALFLAATFLPFGAYAGIRFIQAPVRADAERSLLLFWLPFLLGCQCVFAFTAPQRRILRAGLIATLFSIGSYGIVNHLVADSRRVLWAAGYDVYRAEHRATACFFCPDHFSGAMELALCLGLGSAADRSQRALPRIGSAVLCAVAFGGIVLSKSRGGALTLLVILAATLWVGFVQWPRRARGWYRLSAACAMAILVLVALRFAPGVIDRFRSEFGWRGAGHPSLAERGRQLYHRVLDHSRGRMAASALRAWSTNRAFGIGPGMHQNLWPHFSASADGDRTTGAWPSRPYFGVYSYEVHSDWIQLLEEYGWVGLLLFAVPATAVPYVLLRAVRAQARQRRAERRSASAPEGNFAALAAGLLACAAFAFHSLGDFTLQIPAIGWMLAVTVALPLKTTVEAPPVDAG